MYGTILAKMWRVYQIFHSPNPNKSVCVHVPNPADIADHTPFSDKKMFLGHGDVSPCYLNIDFKDMASLLSFGHCHWHKCDHLSGKYNGSDVHYHLLST